MQPQDKIAAARDLSLFGGHLAKAIPSHKYIRDEFLAMGDWKGVCWASLGLAQIYRIKREYTHSIVEFKHAQEIALLGGNVVGASWSVRGMAEVAKENGDYHTSEKLAHSARADFLSIGYKLGAAYALKTQAEAVLKNGRIKEALDLGIKCQEEFVNCGERRGIGFALLTLGTILFQLEEYNQAIFMLQKSKFYLAHPSGREPSCFSPTAALQHIFSSIRGVKPYGFNTRFCGELDVKKTEQEHARGLQKAARLSLRYSHTAFCSR